MFHGLPLALLALVLSGQAVVLVVVETSIGTGYKIGVHIHVLQSANFTAGTDCSLGISQA